MKFIPKYITTDILAEYGEHLTHEAYNEMVLLNSTQGDYNTKILNQLFNTDEGIQIPYLQNTINEIKEDQERLDNDMDDIVAEMVRIKGSLSKYTTFCDVRRMIQNATQDFVKINKLKAGNNIDIVVDALNNVTISTTSDVTKQYVDEQDALILQDSKAYTDDAVAHIDLSDYATIQYVDNAIAQIDLSDYATIQYVDDAIAAIPIPVVPTNVSAFINDAGYITSHDIPPVVESDPYFSASPAAGITAQDITDWNNKSNFSGDYNDLQNKPTIPVVPTNISAFNNDAGYLTSESDPVFSASAAAGIQATDITAWNNKSDFSGDYNDLTNKPTIPVVPTNVSAFTNDAGYITGYTETDPVFTASIATQTTQTAGKVYDVTYINTMLGNIEALLGGI